MKLNDLTLTGMEIAKRETDVATTKIRSLGETYDEHAKLVFLLDISGSMGARIAEGFTDIYLWSPEKLNQIRAQVEIARAIEVTNRESQLNPPYAPDTEDEDSEDEDPKESGLSWQDEETLKMIHAGPLGDDKDIKERIIRLGLTDHFGIIPNPAHADKTPPTRLEAVKRLAKQEIQNRINKYRDAKVAFVAFALQAELRYDSGLDVGFNDDNNQPMDFMTLLNDLEIGLGGGTEILTAIRKAMDSCRKNPSSVGLHHFVLVSDGDDYAADANIGSWVPSLKASGIVLDYIHIGDHGMNQGIVEACKLLGGDSQKVDTLSALEEKFVEASRRLMLPPGN